MGEGVGGSMGRRQAGPADYGTVRIYRLLEQAAAEGRRCPSSRELCGRLGLSREARVTQILALLRGRKLIDIEWSAPDGGARRVTIRASGLTTGWSRMGPEPAAAGPEDDEAEDAQARVSARAGMEALARALEAAGERFKDVSRIEATRIARDTPADPGLPEKPAPRSYMTSTLAPVQPSVPDPGNDPFIERRQ